MLGVSVMASQENSSSVFYTLNFDDVQKAESRRINEYRAHNRRKPLLNANNLPLKGPIDSSGLALSGGGIRSAAFCLGVLQALESEVGIEKIDYLSTVSGGGYIGLSLSVGMNKTGDSQGNYRFPFMTNKDEKGDNPVVGHIRNHSRYLIPGGMKDLLSSLTVVLRGLSANIFIVSATIYWLLQLH